MFGLRCGVRPWWLVRACWCLDRVGLSLVLVTVAFAGARIMLVSPCLGNGRDRRRLDRVGLSFVVVTVALAGALVVLVSPLL